MDKKEKLKKVEEKIKSKKIFKNNNILVMFLNSLGLGKITFNERYGRPVIIKKLMNLLENDEKIATRLIDELIKIEDQEISVPEIHMKLIKGFYRHYKGNTYRVVDECLNESDLEEMVLYRSIIKPSVLWVRPKKEFIQNVIFKGKVLPRFLFLKKG